jgi:hypothetical protein
MTHKIRSMLPTHYIRTAINKYRLNVHLFDVTTSYDFTTSCITIIIMALKVRMHGEWKIARANFLNPKAFTAV